MSEYESFITAHKHQDIGDDYFETHHIIPRCAGGTDNSDNLIKLFPQQHVIAHKLLMDCYHGDIKRKLSFAYHMMVTNREGSRVDDIDKAREYLSSSQKGIKRDYSEERRTLLKEQGIKNLSNADNTGMVVAKRISTGEFERVTTEEYHSSDDLIWACTGKDLRRKNPINTVVHKWTEEQKKIFGKPGDSNPASANKSLIRYGLMSGDEFRLWSIGKTKQGIKRATTFRKRYKDGEKNC